MGPTRARIRRGLLALLLAMACVLWAAPARAFDPVGHDLIEAQAYRRLVETNLRYPDGVGGYVSGAAMLASLVVDGVLVAPSCFGPSASSDACREARSSDPMRWWPPLRSGRADYVLDRHYGVVGQCYHFLAHRGDEGSGADANGAPAGLAAAPYRRCMRLLGTLVEVAAGAGAGDAHGLDNDTYALLHAVADAFSEAHAERDARGRLAWLRVWNALPWLTPRDPRRRHLFHDPRDAAYVRADRASDPRCDVRARHPYSVDPSCLSAPAARAVAALDDVLALVYRMRRRARAGHTPLLAVLANRLDWDQLIDRHLGHAHLPVDGVGLAPYELDAWPRVAVGLGADLDGPDAHPGAHVGVMVPLFVLGRDRFLPFTPNASLELGVLPGYGFHAAADLTFSLPVAPWLWVGAAPVRVAATLDTSGRPTDYTVGFMAPRVDVFQLGRRHFGLWARLAGPGYYDLVSARWQWQAALSVGLHFDATLDVQPDLSEPEERPNRHASADRDAVRTWTPPWFTGEALSPSPAQTSLYVAFGGRTGGGVGGGVEALRSLGGALHAVDLGAALVASGPGAGHAVAFELDAAVRVRPVPLLALDVVPAGVGVELGGDGRAPDWTLVGRLGASLLLGPLRVSVGLPPLDYRRMRVDVERGVDLRFSVDLASVLQWRDSSVSLGSGAIVPSP